MRAVNRSPVRVPNLGKKLLDRARLPAGRAGDHCDVTSRYRWGAVLDSMRIRQRRTVHVIPERGQVVQID